MGLKVLVLGSTGMIGHQVFNYLAQTEKYDMYNFAYRSKLNDRTILCDVRNQEEFIEQVNLISPDIIINCIGVLIEQANEDPESAIYINSFFPHRLMRLADEKNCKLIHISTDCVFSGEKGIPYVEGDIKDGRDTYAKTKGLGEILNDNHLTLRTSVIGPELKTNGVELFHWFMQQSGDIKGYTNVIWSGVTTLVLARVVGWAIENDTTGLYHVTNNESIDKFTLLNLIKKHTKKNILIHPCNIKKSNKSFRDSRNELNFAIPSYEKMIDEMIRAILKDKTTYKQYIS